MTTLVADQLGSDPLEQAIVLYRDHDLAGIRPSLYFHNLPAGTFYLRIYQDGVSIKEYTFTSASARAAIGTPHNYFWVDLALSGRCRLSSGEYIIKLESTGYTSSYSSAVMWLKDWTSLRSDCIDTVVNFTEHPFSFNLIEYREREF
jgi:hypothetical protein